VKRRFALSSVAALLAAITVWAVGGAVLGRSGSEPLHVEITIHYSHYEPAAFRVPAGRPVEVVLRNTDPIDHEWIVGDAALHARHRTGTEPYHAGRPTEVTIPALSTITTVVTFASPGSLQYICHLPGHEAYGMVGTVTITP
jgi:uncharacterized cupredoxin-like copper-binding protein